jgi:hypothetical protein
MNDAVSNARQKLDEAGFYLQLMDRIETERRSLTEGREPKTEFSYLLSAFLNACYSCTEYLSRQKASAEAAERFQKEHATLYGRGPNGGWRTRAVHYRHVEPQRDGYIPPPGENIILKARGTRPAEPQTGKSITLTAGPGRFYFSEDGPQNSICELCAVHLDQLRQLVDACAQST